MIELRHSDVSHFIIEEWNHLANGKMWLHRFDVISLSIMSGLSNVRQNTIGFVSVYMHTESVTIWCHVVQTFTRRP